MSRNKRQLAWRIIDQAYPNLDSSLRYGFVVLLCKNKTKKELEKWKKVISKNLKKRLKRKNGMKTKQLSVDDLSVILINSFSHIAGTRDDRKLEKETYVMDQLVRVHEYRRDLLEATPDSVWQEAWDLFINKTQQVLKLKETLDKY